MNKENHDFATEDAILADLENSIGKAVSLTLKNGQMLNVIVEGIPHATFVVTTPLQEKPLRVDQVALVAPIQNQIQNRAA